MGRNKESESKVQRGKERDTERQRDAESVKDRHIKKNIIFPKRERERAIKKKETAYLKPNCMSRN